MSLKLQYLMRNARRALSIVWCSCLSASVAAQHTNCTATASEFEAIATGMSVKQVEQIIGCSGEVLSESRVADIHTVMLMWSGRGMMGANMNVMFQNGRVIMKSQFGLR